MSLSAEYGSKSNTDPDQESDWPSSSYANIFLSFALILSLSFFLSIRTSVFLNSLIAPLFCLILFVCLANCCCFSYHSHQHQTAVKENQNIVLFSFFVFPVYVFYFCSLIITCCLFLTTAGSVVFSFAHQWTRMKAISDQTTDYSCHHEYVIFSNCHPKASENTETKWDFVLNWMVRIKPKYLLTFLLTKF